MRKFIVFVLVFSMTLAFTACGGSEKTSVEADPDSTEDKKIQIVFEYQDGHIHNDFESTLESLFNVDIVMNMCTSANVCIRLEEELTHNMAPDLVLCEYMSRIDKDILTNYFYDLGSESFVNNYYLSAIESCTASDGGLYYIPGPSYVYGIVYDKTAFQELGLSVPHNYTEFVQLIQTVNDMGLTGTEIDPDDETKTVEVPIEAFVPTIRWCDMFQIIFNTMNYERCIRGNTNAMWLRNYQNGEESMVGHMEPAAEKYLQMFEDGVLSLDYWSVIPGYRSRKLYDYHTSLMNIECQQGYEFNKSINENNPDNLHEMGMMPIYTSDEPDSDYLYAIPRSFVGISKQGTKDPEKLEMLLKIMDYLSTPDGQKLLINGSDYFGFLKDDVSLGSDFYSDVTDTIEAGRIISNFYYGGEDHGSVVENYMHEATPDLVNGDITIQEWLEGADEVRDQAHEPKEKEIYGVVPDTLLPLQTAYIDGLAYLNSMEADIGYVPVSANYGTQVYLYSGDITDDKIVFVTTENFYGTNSTESDMEYVVVEMTGQELLDLALAQGENGMAAFAGIEMEYSMSGTEGGQYKSLKIDGVEMDRKATYRVAALRGAVPHAKVLAEYPDLTFRELFTSYVSVKNGKIDAPEQLVIVD